MEPVGRFGVGFSAVLAVTDCPSLLSRSGGVRFSSSETRALVQQAAARSPGLAAELERRRGHVPVLRLPFPAEGEPPSGFDSAVLLPLRDGAARDLVLALLEQVDDALLLALPALAEIVVELPSRPPRRLADVEDRWFRLTRSGTHAPEALADRPTEERERLAWSVTWAVPRGAGGGTDVSGRVLHAPTPTDEPLPWPGLLVATFPLESTRRAVADGPATDALVGVAAETYVALLVERARDGADVLPLLPLGLPAGSLDAHLRQALLPLLAGSPILPALDDGARLRPREAVALGSGPWAGDEQVLRPLASVLAGLTPAPTTAEPALRLLGVRRLPLADLVDQLPVQPDPQSWVRLYRALAPVAAEPLAREALSALPVPLLDGRVVRGPRGAVLVRDDVPPQAVDVLARTGQRVVHPEVAADPSCARLLERLGAASAGPAELLASPELREAVTRAADGDTDEQTWSALPQAVLALLAACADAGTQAYPRLPWLAELLLPDADGDLVPADLLVQPGSVAAELLDPDAVGTLAPDLFAAWPGAVWEAVGVAGSLVPRTWRDVDTSDLPDDLAEMDGAGEWAEQLGPSSVAELVAVRDLDLVRTDAWPAALELIGSDPALRPALLDPVRVVGLDGVARSATGYTAWWLRGRLGLAGRPGAGADPLLLDLLPAAPSWAASLEPALAATIGLVTGWDDLDADTWDDVLRAVHALDQAPPLPALLAMWAALGRAAPDLASPPSSLWALRGGEVLLVDGEDVVAVDDPMWLQRDDLAAVVVQPEHAGRLADVLDVDLASERAPGRVESRGERAQVPAVVRALLGEAPEYWYEHERLVVDAVEADWWVEPTEPEPLLHAATLSGLARALAQASGRWDLRFALEYVLTSPDEARTLLVEEAVSGRCSPNGPSEPPRGAIPRAR
ncbi:MAG: hypothetical protein ACLGIA_11075 [Actinomycetes bacterium]